MPIGALFSASLIFSNLAYLTLSVSFIQMCAPSRNIPRENTGNLTRNLPCRLKAFTSVAVLLMSVVMGLDTLNRRKATVVFAISLGVALASYGEMRFVFAGFVFQCLGIVFEATRLVAIQKLLQGMRMDPVCRVGSCSAGDFDPDAIPLPTAACLAVLLCTGESDPTLITSRPSSPCAVLAPAQVCAVFNMLLVPIFEGWAPLDHVLERVGVATLVLNCSVALCLNISVVFLIGCASSLVLTLSGKLGDFLLPARHDPAVGCGRHIAHAVLAVGHAQASSRISCSSADQWSCSDLLLPLSRCVASKGVHRLALFRS